MRASFLCIFSVILLLAASDSYAGCRCSLRKYHETYAVLYVTSEPSGATVVSTSDGQTLDDGTGTPSRTLFKKSRFPYADQPIGLLVYAACSKPSFQRVTVNRWYRTVAEAQGNPNVVRVTFNSYSSCTP
jgi:hypothetical protein